jgi:hypothetical protein
MTGNLAILSGWHEIVEVWKIHTVRAFRNIVKRIRRSRIITYWAEQEREQTRLSRATSWYLGLAPGLLIIHQHKSPYSCPSVRLSSG